MASVAMVSGVLVGHLRPRVRRLAGHLRLRGQPTPPSSAVVITPPAAATRRTPRRPHDRAPRPRQVTAPLPVRPAACRCPSPARGSSAPATTGPKVRDLQARLRQIAWYFGNVTDDWDRQTTAAVKGFQEKREIAVTGYVDQRTLDRLARDDPDARPRTSWPTGSPATCTPTRGSTRGA